MNSAIERLDDKLKISHPDKKKGKTNHHRTEAVDRVYMACARSGTNVNDLLDSIEDGTAFDLAKFRSTPEGNIFDFVKPDLLEAVKYFPHITAGGNGGMASIGKGEFAIAFLSNFSTIMITERSKDKDQKGKGDLKHSDGTYEEVKFNGGKINIDDQRGEDVGKRFNQIVESKNLVIRPVPNTGGGFLPLWSKKNWKKVYSEDEIKERNGCYYEAVTGEHIGPLTDNEIRKIFVDRSFDNIFKKIDYLLVMDEDGSYVRFSDPKVAKDYYKDLPVTCELRNKQTNPSTIYLNTKNHKNYLKKLVEFKR